MSLFLIAEIGINHNGNIEIAKKLITHAKEAGFDAVKFQKRTVEKKNFSRRNTLKGDRLSQKEKNLHKEFIFEMKKNLWY